MAHRPIGSQTGGDVATGDSENCAIGCSQREERYEVLAEKIRSKGLPEEAYKWYLDLRKYGSAPHAGFGLGLERMMMYLTGMKNIRDVIPFPRTPGSAEF